MSNLAEGWNWVPLGELGNYINGRAFKPLEWKASGLPIIRIQNLNDQTVSFNYSDQEHEAKYKVKNGDLLIAWSASLGVSIWDRGDAWLNQHIFRVEPYENIVLKEFLLYAVRQARGELYEKAHGSGMVHVTKPVFESHQVPLPSLAEQRRIVAKLETLLGKVDACQQRLAKIPVILKRFRQAVLAAACSGELMATYRLRELLAEPLSNGHSVVTASLGFPVLRLTCLKNGRIDLSEYKIGNWAREDAKKYFVRKGDFFASRGNGSLSFVGRGGIVEQEPGEIAFPDTLIRIRANNDRIAPNYLSLVWNSTFVRQQIELAAHTTAGIWKISQKDMENFMLPVPPLAEQQEIVRRVEALFQLADQLESRYQRAKAQVDKLQQSILAKAFRGELVPTEAELARREGREYESAAALLERIKSARIAPPKRKEKNVPTQPSLLP